MLQVYPTPSLSQGKIINGNKRKQKNTQLVEGALLKPQERNQSMWQTTHKDSR